MTDEGIYYLFMRENVDEWRSPEETGGHGLMIWISPYAIDDFVELVGETFWDDGYGYKTTCLCPGGGICVEDFDYWLSSIGIDWKDIFKKEENEKTEKIK